MSSVPTATERSPWPPGFSFFIMTFQAFSGSILLPSRSRRAVGEACRSLGIILSRRMPCCAYLPLEWNPNPITGFPSRMTSVCTATADTVISEKLMKALLIDDFMGTTRSRISVILILLGSTPLPIADYFPPEHSDTKPHGQDHQRHYKSDPPPCGLTDVSDPKIHGRRSSAIVRNTRVQIGEVGKH